jgi:hypothetical protein
MLVWSVLSKTNNFVNFLSQKYIFIFITLLLLTYFDSSFIELSETFHLPENKAFLIGILFIYHQQPHSN